MEEARPNHPGQVKPHPKEKRDKGFELYKQGREQVDIAYELQIPFPTIRAWCKRDKWEERKLAELAGTSAETAVSLAKTLVVRKVTSATQDQSADKLDLAEKQTKYQEDMAAVALRMAAATRLLDDDELFARANKIKDMDVVARKALKLETDKASTILQIAILNQPQARSDREQAANQPLTIDV